MERKYNYTFSELLDRLSIVQLKEMLIPDHKEEYAAEMAAILSDIQSIIDTDAILINANTLRDLVVLAQINAHIWHNEANYRKGIREGNSLELTHGLNGIRNTAKNKITSASVKCWGLSLLSSCSSYVVMRDCKRIDLAR